MSHQKVFRLGSKGAGIGSLKENSEPIPKAKAYEVVLKIHATTLNYRDFQVANGTYPRPIGNNVVPLSDGAGTIVEVGESVSDFEQGDWAITTFDPTHMYGALKSWTHNLGALADGVLREYIALPAAGVVKIPKSTTLSWAELAALVCTGATCWNTLYGNIPLRPGQTVLALGTGGISMTGIMLAKAAGATTIITSSSDSKLALAKETYGADHGINYLTTPNWQDEVNRLTDGEGADYIFENGGTGTIAQSIECVARGGQIGVIGYLAEQPESMPDVAMLALAKGCVLRGINVGSRQITGAMAAFACRRNLGVRIERTFGFERGEILRAFEEIGRAGHVGKIAIQVV